MTMRIDNKLVYSSVVAVFLATIGCQTEGDVDGGDATLAGIDVAGVGGYATAQQAQTWYPVGGTGILPPYIPGDFSRKCQNCRMRSPTQVSCECYGRQSVADLPCGYLTAMNGALVCSGMPKGSYARTCRNCTVYNDGSTVSLQCECKDVSGAWKQATPLSITPTECANVANLDGELVCAPSEVDTDSCQFASGSYAPTCHFCTMSCEGDASSMSCICAPASTSDSIEPTSCIHEEVANRSGDLQCE